MKRLLPALLCFLALAVPRLYGQQTYPVTFSATEGGTLTATVLTPWTSINSGDQVVAGSDITFYGVANEGYQLDYWEINGVRSDITDYSLAMEELQAPLDIIAHFKAAPAEGYAVHFAAVGSGKVTASYLGGSYWGSTELKDGESVPAGTRVTFDIVPEGDKVVGDWTIDGKVRPELYGKKSVTYTVIAETTLSVAIIDPVYHKLTFESTEGASLTAMDAVWNTFSSGDSVKRGTVITFSPTFENDYKLDHWEVNSETYPHKQGQAYIDYQVMSDTHVKLFARMKDKYPVTFSAEANGEVAAFVNMKEISSGVELAEESVVTLLAKPAEGYHLVGWTLAGDTIGKGIYLVHKIKNESSDIVAHFAAGADEENLPAHFSAGEGGTLSALTTIYSPSYMRVPLKDGFLVKKGERVEFTAQPDTLYMVKSWSINGEVKEYYNGQKDFSHYFRAADTIRVTFEQFVPRIVTFDASPAEGGSVQVKDGNWENVESGAAVPDGTKLSISAYERDGYRFDYWEIDGVRSTQYTTERIYDYILTQDVSFRAVFKALAKMPITFSANGAGTVDGSVRWGDKISSGDEIQEGTTLRFVATAEADAKLRDWTINGSDTLAGQTDILYTVLVDKANTIVANFISTAAPKAVVTYSYDGEGALACTDKMDGSPVVSGSEVAVGKTLQFVATPSTGYAISGWTINGQELYPDQTTIEYIVVEGTNQITARFKQASTTEGHLVTFFATPAEGGTVKASYFGEDYTLIPIVSGDRVKESDWLKFVATASEGYKLEKWIVDGEEVPIDDYNPNEYSHTIHADLTVEAIFKYIAAPSKVTLTYSAATPGGKLSVLAFPATGDPYPVESGDELDYGTTLSFQAEADPGYEVEKWEVNGQVDNFAGNDNMMTMAIQKDMEVKVYFKQAGEPEPEGYTVTFSAVPAEGGTIVAQTFKGFSLVGINSGDKLSEYSAVNFTATASEGYELEKWIVNGVDEPLNFATPEKYSIEELEADTDVKAVFKQTAPVVTYPVTLTATPGGKLSAKVGSDDNEREVKSGEELPAGTIITVEATADDGYELTELTANGTDIKKSLMCEVKDGPMEIKATFAKNSFVVTLQSNEHGTISIVEAVDLKAVPRGTKLTVKAEGKNDKCVLTKLSANGKDILNEKSFTVTEDVTVIAEFVDHTAIDAVTATTLSIYPNPAREYTLVTGLAPDATVALYTLEGQMLQSLRADHTGSLQIDLTALGDGTYLVVTERGSQRLVIQH